MRFNVPSRTLYNYASAVSKVINPKNALSILDNFLFTLEEGHLWVMGSDVENALAARLEVFDAEGTGKFCLNANKLVDLLKVLPDQPITFEINDDTLEVKISYHGADFTMVAIDGNQFPEYRKEADDSQEPATFEYPSAQIVKGIENTSFAVGTDDYHPQMMGILLDIAPDSITYVATDTRKMVRYSNFTSFTGVTAKCILPIKPANILKNILSKDDKAKVTVTLTPKSATFETENYVFNCRFIKGVYPDYNRVIPKQNPYQLRVDRNRFLNCVRRVGVFVDPGYGMEKFRITTDHIDVKSSDSSLQREGFETIECEYTGPDIIMGFSAPYLVEICNVLTTQDILVHLSDPSRPGVFCPTENEEATDMLVLLMPMNVTDF